MQLLSKIKPSDEACLACRISPKFAGVDPHKLPSAKLVISGHVCCPAAKCYELQSFPLAMHPKTFPYTGVGVIKLTMDCQLQPWAVKLGRRRLAV
jgi:hypothetical protein